MKKTVWIACERVVGCGGRCYFKVSAYSPTELERLLSLDYKPLYAINVYQRST